MNDNQLIDRLGGVKPVADFLCCNYSTVHNWLKRGIPAHIKVKHPDVFMPREESEIVNLADLSKDPA